VTLYQHTRLGKVSVYCTPQTNTFYCATQAVNISSESQLDLNQVQIKPTLLEEDKSRLLNLINEYSPLFVRNDNDLGRTSMVTHSIETGDHPPIRQQPYRTAQKQREIIEQKVKTMLEKGVIRQSQSPWSSPVVIVPKKTGGFRFCIDYRKLNSATKKDSYPLPRIDDILETLNNCAYFTT